jgi:hypothetical protein
MGTRKAKYMWHAEFSWRNLSHCCNLEDFKESGKIQIRRKLEGLMRRCEGHVIWRTSVLAALNLKVLLSG